MLFFMILYIFYCGINIIVKSSKYTLVLDLTLYSVESLEIRASLSSKSLF